MSSETNVIRAILLYMGEKLRGKVMAKEFNDVESPGSLNEQAAKMFQTLKGCGTRFNDKARSRRASVVPFLKWLSNS